MTLAFIPTGATQGHPLVERDVITNFSGLTDDNAHAVIDKEASTDLRPRMNLDTGQPATKVRQHARQPLPTRRPQVMGQAMQPDSVQTRIAGQHLKGVARRRIAMEYALNIFSHALEHQTSLRLWASPRAAF